MKIKSNKIFLLLIIAALSRLLLFLTTYAYLDGVNFPYSLCQWDCGWYLSIINDGYDKVPHGYPEGNVANWPFFPLFPILVSGLKLILPINSINTALLLNNGLFFALVIILYQYVKPLIGEDRAFKGVAAFCFIPFTIYLSIPYSESLYLTLLFLGLTYINKQKYLMAVICGMLLSVTRNGGVFFVIIFITHYISMLLCKIDDKELVIKKVINLVLAVLAFPVLFELYCLYLYFITGDALAFVHIQRGYGRIVGRSPIETIISIYQSPDPYTIYCLVALFAGVLSSIWLIKRKMFGMGLFSLFPLVLTLYTGNLSGMSRYSFLSLSVIMFFIFQYSKLSLSYYIFGLFCMVNIFIMFVYFWINGYSYMI